ncbi:MAG: hypothetical protein M1813_007896 [Trichoglossum hirsutum]|nr:MAG: hypothetical protein M1813_007896 [Trichoglossum hirsutum]
MSTPPSEDPYKVLGVPKDATKDTIRSAHRKLVLQSHPDKVQDESLRAQKQDEFQRVQQAYELLIDELRRQQYDETVKRDELRRQVAEERAKSRRYDLRSSPRDFDERRSHMRPHEDGRPRSFDDGISSSKYETFGVRHPTRSFEGRKSSNRAEEDERVHVERERKRDTDRAAQSERRRTRDRERRRGYDDKYVRTTTYYSDEDESRIPKEPGKVHIETAEPRGDASRGVAEKLFAAQEYIRRASEEIPPRHHAGGRSRKTYYSVPPPQPPTPPVAVVDDPSIRRSAARPRDRERKRESSRPSSRGKEARIVDPQRYHETRTKNMPPLSTSVSSPSDIDIPPLSGRPHHSHSRSMAQASRPPRSATMDPTRPRPDGMPTFPRSNTSPMTSSTSRKETVPGKSKEKVIKSTLGEAGFDSGYSSSTQDSSYLGGVRMSSSPPNRFEPRSSPKIGSFIGKQMYDEPTEYSTEYIPPYPPRSRPLSREPGDLYERRSKSRSPSPSSRHMPEGSSRSRAPPATMEFASGRPTQYVYPKDPSRVSPTSSRIPTDTPPRRAFGDVSYSPRIDKRDITYAPQYTPNRRSAGSHGHSHYPRPQFARAETATY